jgi:hypothetical protein
VTEGYTVIWLRKKMESKTGSSKVMPGVQNGQVTERDAVIRVNQHMINSAIQMWPGLYKKVGEIVALPFIVPDEEQAAFDLALAALALDLQAVRNLYSNDQAGRIEAWAYELGRSAKYGDYALKELKRYSEAFQSELRLIGVVGNHGIEDDLFAEDYSSDMSLDLGRYLLRSVRFWLDPPLIPVGIVCALLLYRLIGDELMAHGVEFQGKKTGVMNPTLLGAVIHVLCAPPFVGTWKHLRDNFVLVER